MLLKKLFILFCTFVITPIYAQTQHVNHVHTDNIAKPVHYVDVINGDNSPLPEFSFMTMDGKPFTNKDIKFKHKALIIYFDPGCNHCQHQAEEMSLAINQFNFTKLFFVSISATEEIIKFQKKYFNGTKNVTFLQDAERKIFYTFKNVTTTPTTIIYNKSLQQIGIAHGQTSVEKLAPFIKKN